MDKKKAKPFQIITTIVFVVLIVIAVAVFSQSDRSTPKGPNEKTLNYGPVTVWGTVPNSQEMTQLFSQFNKANEKTLSATYVYVPGEVLEQKLLEALSNDKGPDAIILPSEWLHRNRLRITTLPYDPAKGGMSERQFKDTFTQAGEVFLYPEGIVSLPLAIDPLVMYWNRDLFTDAGVVSPPVFWKELLPLTSKLTQKKNLDIIESAIALGEYENVKGAKDILSLMFLQVGNPITRVLPGGGLAPTLLQDQALLQSIRFYVDFANPLKSSYSWNRSLPVSEDAFLAGDLAMYLDLASAYPTLSKKNPRLNFDVAPVPQIDGQKTAVTYGKIHGIVVMKKGKNVPGGTAFMKLFSAKESADLFAKVSGMAPMRRDLLAAPQSDAYQATLYGAALRARSWIDPQPLETNTIFSRLIEGVISGKTEAESAVGQADTEIASLISTQ